MDLLLEKPFIGMVIETVLKKCLDKKKKTVFLLIWRNVEIENIFFESIV